MSPWSDKLLFNNETAFKNDFEAIKQLKTFRKLNDHKLVLCQKYQNKIFFKVIVFHRYLNPDEVKAGLKFVKCTGFKA